MRIITLIAQLFFILPYVPAAQDSQWELGKWWKNSEIVEELQLNEAQVGRIEESFMEYRPALARANSELKELQAELKALMDSDHPDESAVVRQTELVAAARAELEKTYSLMMFSIRKHLSQEQWERLAEIRELRKALSSLVSPIPPTTGASGDKIYIVGGGVRAPVALHQPLPAYTQAARDARIEGIVIMRAVIRKDGTVGDIEILRGLGHGLNESAIDTVKNRWKFKPGTLDGNPVDVRVSIEVSFRLY
jgi:TonB family protein